MPQDNKIFRQWIHRNGHKDRKTIKYITKLKNVGRHLPIPHASASRTASARVRGLGKLWVLGEGRD